MKVFDRLIDRYFEHWPFRKGDIWWQVLALPSAAQIFLDGFASKLPLANFVADIVENWLKWKAIIIELCAAWLFDILDIEFPPLVWSGILLLAALLPIILRIILFSQYEQRPSRVIKIRRPMLSRFVEIVLTFYFIILIMWVVIPTRGMLVSACVGVVLIFIAGEIAEKLSAKNDEDEEDEERFRTWWKYVLFWVIVTFVVGAVSKVFELNFVGILGGFLFAIAATFAVYGGLLVAFGNWRLQFIITLNVVWLVVANYALLAAEPTLASVAQWYETTSPRLNPPQ